MGFDIKARSFFFVKTTIFLVICLFIFGRATHSLNGEWKFD